MIKSLLPYMNERGKEPKLLDAAPVLPVAAERAERKAKDSNAPRGDTTARRLLAEIGLDFDDDTPNENGDDEIASEPRPEDTGSDPAEKAEKEDGDLRAQLLTVVAETLTHCDTALNISRDLRQQLTVAYKKVLGGTLLKAHSAVSSHYERDIKNFAAFDEKMKDSMYVFRIMEDRITQHPSVDQLSHAENEKILAKMQAKGTAMCQRIDRAIDDTLRSVVAAWELRVSVSVPDEDEAKPLAKQTTPPPTEMLPAVETDPKKELRKTLTHFEKIITAKAAKLRQEIEAQAKKFEATFTAVKKMEGLEKKYASSLATEQYEIIQLLADIAFKTMERIAQYRAELRSLDKPEEIQKLHSDVTTFYSDQEKLLNGAQHRIQTFTTETDHYHNELVTKKQPEKPKEPPSAWQWAKRFLFGDPKK